ncbi:hypothetical protein NEOLEDRAFT_1140266 [Neolentinus lepideus HHB14362 ss-1]|uniref:GAR domain-containing protein n=1 Tax=Neolentinus lepideus HHB14362 ss-1 TaxID=1314782 RepID=A0A165PA68_9AGAM|nr:hypothetical protein NEOLEDRAFT_1140266 [Neolentinus lepideus HHB14362 ss-1]
MDAVRASAETVPGLPSRDQLRQWMEEHDKIEKEIMVFDSGELKKLREVTKAASKRNLSPEDTDLIELTLTTIYQLDKLLHLLRDRTEHFDLLGTRLTWEEQRVGAWLDYRQVMRDILEFLEGRARWTAAIYDQASKIEETTGRRGSVGSMTSVHSDASSPGSLNFSRSARFRKAEALSRDAAQLASRLTTLRHGKIAAAGKALDKLIDTSRRAVPDELLDEQDRLETKGITDLESLGKFVMGVVMQWKKADEIYVESIKDQAAAQTLIEEIMSARCTHPTVRQAAAYTSRVDVLIKRLQTRTNPASPISTFPRPSHPLHPEQKTVNDSVVRVLSEEIKTAMELSTRAGTLAKDYSDTLAAVKRIETLAQAADSTSARLTSMIARLANGITTSDGDGSPPDLTSEACLEAQHHEVYLALLPSLLGELAEQKHVADEHLGQLRDAMTDVDMDCLDHAFVASITASINGLAQCSSTADDVRSQVERRVALLRDVRKVWAVVTQTRHTLEGTWGSMEDAMVKDKYVSAVNQSGQPLTPESPIEDISLPSLDSIGLQLNSLGTILEQTIPSLLLPLTQDLEPTLYHWIDEELRKMVDALQRMRDMCKVWQMIRAQANAMSVVRDDVDRLQIRIEDFKTRYDVMIQDVLTNVTTGDTKAPEGDVSFHDLHESVKVFTDSLVQRVPLITSLSPMVSLSPASPSSRRQASLDESLGSRKLRWDFRLEVPVDPTSLDGLVRTDLNIYSMRLAGELQALLRKQDHYNVTRKANALDKALSSFETNISRAEADISNLKQKLDSLESSALDNDAMNALLDEADNMAQSYGPALAQSIVTMQTHVHEMETKADNLDTDTHDMIIRTRKRKVEDARQRSASWNANVDATRRSILQAQRALAERLQKEQLAETQRLQEEREGLEAERLELERQEERQAMEAKRLELGRLETDQKAALVVPAKEKRETQKNAHCDQRDATDNSQLKGVKSQDMPVHESGISEEGVPTPGIANGDVFSLKVPTVSAPVSQDVLDLQAKIFAIRKQLRALSLDKIAKPTSSNTSLPTDEDRKHLMTSFSMIVEKSNELPASVDNVASAELTSLRADICASQELMERIHQLADLTLSIQSCDNCLSDLLEHIDSYPLSPAGPLLSTHVSDVSSTSENQLRSRIAFTRAMITDMQERYARVSDDSRAIAEKSRISQTWEELEEMSNDRLTGPKSRPTSVISSGRNSSISMNSGSNSGSSRSGSHRKSDSYANLSTRPSRGRHLVPPPVLGPKRSTSGTTSASLRSSSRLSVASSQRSISGSQVLSPSTIYSPTFASRQRTMSTSSNSSTLVSAKRVPATPKRPRAQTGHSWGRRSPNMSDASSYRSTTSMSTWSRGPRDSIPSLRRVSTPKTRIPQAIKKPYVPNPKNKLDVAVGDVVNNLPVNINIEVVADTWKDQSGKYWIGDQEPKLCFCRILRSQTVMVRVGGGWTELSKFIKDHFADLFRLMPESPPGTTTAREEKWISSRTLLDNAGDSYRSQTPELKDPPLPTFALSTPSGKSPHSIKSTSSSGGSPLTPLQFMRRAEGIERPVTPTKPPPSVVRKRKLIPNTPSRAPAPVWRP